MKAFVKNKPALVLAGVMALVAIVFVVVQKAKPEPSPASAPAPSPTPLLQSSSTQPKISWSQKQIEITLSPGETASRTLTFTSDQNLQNLVIQPVPEIAGFLSVQPSALATVPAGQSQTVQISFSIPVGATLGTYQGTIHLRSGSQTLPQTVKVVLSIWPQLILPDSNLILRYPPSLLAATSGEPEEESVSFYTDPLTASRGLPPDLKIMVLSLPTNSSLEDWIRGKDNTDITYVTLGDKEYIRSTHPVGEGGAYIVVFDTLIDSTHVITFASGNEAFFSSNNFLTILASWYTR